MAFTGHFATQINQPPAGFCQPLAFQLLQKRLILLLAVGFGHALTVIFRRCFGFNTQRMDLLLHQIAYRSKHQPVAFQR